VLLTIIVVVKNIIVPFGVHFSSLSIANMNHMKKVLNDSLTISTILSTIELIQGIYHSLHMAAQRQGKPSMPFVHSTKQRKHNFYL
jgi:hypothetical protein